MKISVKEVRDLYYEYVDSLTFMSYMDNKLFELSYQDYQEMPALTMEVYQLYKNEKAKLLAELSKG